MANDFDQFPLYDDLTKGDTPKMSERWISSMSLLYQNLTSYLSRSGIYAPQLTTADRDAIKTPQLGQIIYNTTAKKFQGYEDGTWKNLI